MSRSTSSAKKKRSDSSLAIRNQLKESFVIVPNIKDSVSLLSYIQLARNLYYSSIEASNKGDLRRAYIDLYKFQKLVLEKIPTHKDYRSNSSKLHDDKRWLEQIKATAMHNLELVVQNLDNEEDIRLLHLDDYNLIDEFDSIDVSNNNINSSNSSANYYNSTSSPFVNPSTLHAVSSLSAVSVPVSSSNISINYTDTTSHSLLTSATNATTTISTQISAIPTTINKSNKVKPIEARDLNRISNIFNTSAYSSSTDISPTISASYPIITISTENTNNNSVHGSNTVMYSPSLAAPSSISSSNFLSEIEWEIISKLGSSLNNFVLPHPSVTIIELRIGPHLYNLYQDDYHTSYASFLVDIPIELQLSRPAVEMNRCFFIHVGIAMKIHPFALQCAFRIVSQMQMEALDQDDFKKDILSSVQQYCGFVDANALCFLWPTEFEDCRIIFISGPLHQPIISCFNGLNKKGGGGGRSSGNRDVIIRCNGDHFTILRSCVIVPGISFTDHLLQAAKDCKVVTQINEFVVDDSISIFRLLKR